MQLTSKVIAMSKDNTPKKIYRARSQNLDSCCRSCLKICDRSHNINLFKPCNSSVLLIAEQILGERLQRDESLPHLLCRPCVRRFNNLIEFKKVVVESQQTLAAECRSKRCKEASPSSMPAAKTSKRESASRRELLFDAYENKVITIYTLF